MDLLIPKTSKVEKLNREIAGGKGANLYRLAKLSRRLRYDVPDFFIIPTNYDGSEANIELATRNLKGEGLYAVRSSSPFEDSQNHSFAGRFKSILDVPWSDLVDAVREVKASAVSEKAMYYAKERGITLDDRMAVIVQRMVNPELGGVIYSTLPDYPIAASIEFCKGLGSGVVDANSETEIHDFDKSNLWTIFDSEHDIETPNLFEFQFAHIKEYHGMRSAMEISQKLEALFGYPLDIEFAWTYDKGRGKLHLLQARAITDVQPYEKVEMPQIPDAQMLLKAEMVRGMGEYEGPAVVHTHVIFGTAWTEPVEQLERNLVDIDEAFPQGYVLIVPQLFGSAVDYDKLTPHKKAVVAYGCSRRTSHGLTVAREKGLLYMCSGDCYNRETNGLTEKNILSKIKIGDIVKVVLDGREGIAYKVRDGKNPFEWNYF